jgi:hypothetical protein
MRRSTNTKDWDSNFVPKLKIPIEAYITELILENKIAFKIKKGEKISKPLVPFWRKDVLLANPELKELAKDFSLEITYVKRLLKVFSVETVISYVKDKGIITLIYLPLEKQKSLLYNIFQNEIDLIDSKKSKSKTVEVPDAIIFKRETKEKDLI